MMTIFYGNYFAVVSQVDSLTVEQTTCQAAMINITSKISGFDKEFYDVFLLQSCSQ